MTPSAIDAVHRRPLTEELALRVIALQRAFVIAKSRPNLSEGRGRTSRKRTSGPGKLQVELSRPRDPRSIRFSIE